MTAEQLKNSILQMAVSGKLVPQDPNDEPASVLLERIRKEKEQLIKEGKIKKEKNPSYIFRGADNTPYEKVGNNDPVSIADEIPFEIPDNWEWTRASSLGKMIRGKGIKRTETVDHGLPCVRYGEIYTSYNTEFSETNSFIPPSIDESCLHFSRGDIIFTLTGENKVDIAKAVAYSGDNQVAAGGDMAFWTAHGMNPLYLVYYMASPYCIEQKRRTATGDIIVHISTDKVGGFLVPVPPIEEQKRIVAKIKDLLPCIDQCKVTEHSLKALNDTFPEQLKKSILQMAVQGKLVAQDPNDEPAYVLLERIRAEKERLIAEGKIKRDKNESVIYRRDNSHYEKLGSIERCIDDEIPFEIPDSWVWCRLGSILQKLSDGTHSTPKYQSSGVPFLSVKDISGGNLDFSGCKYISESEHRELYSRCNPELGDLLLTKVGTTGVPAIVDTEKEFSLFVSVALLKFNQNSIYNKFLLYEILSPLVQKQAEENTRGVGNKNWVMRDIAKTLIAIPPISEQYRIVEMIDRIFPFCDQI